MTAIVSYGVGNLFSLISSCEKIGEKAVVTADIDILKKADRIILPGVGAFGDAIKKLRKTGLDKALCDLAREGKPIMGICLGMQLLFDKSYEYGEHNGLGLIKGEIAPIGDYTREAVKIPHMGWNKLTIKSSPLFKYISDGEYVYFVHSYFGINCEESTVATAEYGKIPITGAVASGNVFGCQFHPEKSGEAGLNILRGFFEIK